MPSFLHPELFWTFGLPTLGVVVLPVLIHLINLTRHRRVEWAAMEFLLASQKKNRTRVLLKQLLLLLLRMAALAIIVVLVAGPIAQNQWGGLLGSTKTHHVVLLDDSLSMSDRWEDTDAFSQATAALRRIAAEAQRRTEPQLFTLLRFSRVGRSAQASEPDFLEQAVERQFIERLDALLGKLSVTQTAAGPLPALQAIAQLTGAEDDRRLVVYVISDFRARQWNDSEELRAELLKLQSAGVELRLVNCVDRARPNLAVVALRPVEGICAAGVPWFMEVAVQNFSQQTVRNVSVSLTEDGHSRPAATIAEIPPGKTAAERFLVNLPQAGAHQITARLSSDAVEGDNWRFYAVDLPADVPVLLVDADTAARDARYLSWALAPGGVIRTGIRPQIETPRFLSRNPLDGFAAVNLLNVERLDAAALAALEKFVADGGGAAFFLGPQSHLKYFTETLYRDGKGLFPLPLARQSELIVDRLEPAPDVQVSDHFIFRVFSGKRNTFLQTVGVERYVASPPGWRPPSDSTVRVLATLRNGDPLAVERQYGRGRVVAVLTTAAPEWNNWARNPTFVVVAQDLQAYLAGRPGEDEPQLVGSPLRFSLDPAIYAPEAQFTAPQSATGDSLLPATVIADNGRLTVELTDTDRSGFYEARLSRNDGGVEVRRYALNVDPTEGDLATLDAAQLAARLPGVKYRFEQAAAFESVLGDAAGKNLTEAVLCALVLLLLAEQTLALSAGYHPAARRNETAVATDGARTHRTQPHPGAVCLLFAAEDTTRTTFEWGRIQSNADWILPVTICILVLLLVRYLYRRDSVELHPAMGWLLTALRSIAFLGLLVLFLQPHWRTEREEVRNSQVLLLVDTSLSMGLPDNPPSTSPESRAEKVAKALAETDLLDRLRKVHDVSVFQFGDDLNTDRAVKLAKAQYDESTAQQPAMGEAIDWSKLLAPTAGETRLGQALRQLIQTERGGPISGIVVLSDGAQNAGIPAESAVEAAIDAKIPVFTVGLGADHQPANVAVRDLVAPARAFPGDQYSATAYIQADGLAGQNVTVELLSRPAGDGPGELIEARQVALGADGEMLPVRFELTPEATGRRTLTLRILPPAGDGNPADNIRETDVEIVDRKNRVLLMAGGPTREYQFLRSLLYRDNTTTLDVLLQSGAAGISQEAQTVLDEFPSTRQEMFAYDCLVAFDPHWQALTPAQWELIEQWVGQQGGGLIVAAGPVYAGKGSGGWTQDPALQIIRNLYPVEFPGRLAALETNFQSGREPWPLEFTREGLDADFLWLADTATASRQAWASFTGVYSFCPVRGPKPGATVFARFSDPRSASGDRQPVYLAGQFYGAGTVFYLGSAEMWRLRAVDEKFFDQFYTKLIRHVSQGRLLRGSTRGVLLVGQDRYVLGNTITVRAQLSDVRLEPLTQPSVNLQVVRPDGSTQAVVMRADPSRPGAYLAQFPALQEGTYRIELPIPDSNGEVLARRIGVNVPNLERENPRRNDALLSTIAQRTGGAYYVGMDAATAADNPNALIGKLRDRTSTIIRTVASNPQWEETLLRWMMMLLCGVLCLEWLIRRLAKLA